MTRARALAAGLLLLVAAVALVATAAPARERPAELGRMAAEGAVTLAARAAPRTRSSPPPACVPGESVGGNVALANVGESRGRLTLLRTRHGRHARPLRRPPLRRAAAARGGDRRRLVDRPAGRPRRARPRRHGAGRGPQLPADADPARTPARAAATTPSRAPRSRSTGRGRPSPSDRRRPRRPRPPTATPAPAPAGDAAGDRARGPAARPRGAPRLELRIPHQRVLGTRGIVVFGRCDRPCRTAFRARIQTSPLGARLGADAAAPARVPRGSARRGGCRSRAAPSGGSGCG